MEIKHIYWFTHYNLLCPSSKYRGKYPTDYFTKSLNISCDFIYPEKSIKGIIRFLSIYFSVLFFRKKSSLIVIQKVCTNRSYAKALKLLVSIRRSNTLYDLDDAEYIRQPKETLEFFMRKCSSISVGSTELERYALKYNSNVFLQTSP